MKKEKCQSKKREPRRATPLETLENFLYCGTIQLNLNGYSPTKEYPSQTQYLNAILDQLNNLGYRTDCISLDENDSYLIVIKPQNYLNTIKPKI